MRDEHVFEATVEWRGNRGTGTSGFRDYGRELELSGALRQTIEASAARVFHGDRDRWNPEELLIGALAQCHMLSYLHMAVRAGVVVTAYTDDAAGTIMQEGLGGRFTEVVLRPRVTVADPSMIDAALSAHDAAHQHCFIANSVNFPVRIEAEITAA
ncbi:OsmC family protein [Leucobacter sp. gxy201]|uniref:OsmC family protein n=1 Tax=Leucobacter sp. gxy201 TaxID=2957200 RepID=UPI003D9FBE4E